MLSEKLLVLLLGLLRPAAATVNVRISELCHLNLDTTTPHTTRIMSTGELNENESVPASTFPALNSSFVEAQPGDTEGLQSFRTLISGIVEPRDAVDTTAADGWSMLGDDMTFSSSQAERCHIYYYSVKQSWLKSGARAPTEYWPACDGTLSNGENWTGSMQHLESSENQSNVLMDWTISNLVFTPSELSIHLAKQNKKLDKIRKEMTRRKDHLAALKESDAKQKADLARHDEAMARLEKSDVKQKADLARLDEAMARLEKSDAKLVRKYSWRSSERGSMPCSRK